MPRINESFVTAMSEYGIKAKELAELVGISPQQVTEFRRGRSWVSQETFESLLENMDRLSPGSKTYFCSLLANQPIASIDKKQQLIEMIETANSEEIEAVLLAIGRKWKKSNSNSKSDSSINNNEYAKVS
ncbi:MAG: DNA-binding protein [Anabaena sp. LE011-02]|nr:MAG: DNA-binding protein [Anabaena sp. LE011-02]